MLKGGGTSLNKVALSSRAEVPQTGQLYCYTVGSSITLHLKRGVSAHLPPILKSPQIGYRRSWEVWVVQDLTRPLMWPT